jgi:hypothetical protein
MSWRNHAHRAKDHRFHNRITQRSRVNPCWLRRGRDRGSGIHHYRGCCRDSQRLLSRLNRPARMTKRPAVKSCALPQATRLIPARRDELLTLLPNDRRGPELSRGEFRPCGNFRYVPSLSPLGLYQQPGRGRSTEATAIPSTICHRSHFAGPSHRARLTGDPLPRVACPRARPPSSRPSWPVTRLPRIGS